MDFVRGQLVRSKAGRDKTRILAVLAVEGPMLWLADGDLRKVGDPKRKKPGMWRPRPPSWKTSF